MTELTAQEQKDLKKQERLTKQLKKEKDRFMNKGYELIEENYEAGTIKLRKKKKFSWFWFLVLCISAVGGIFYLIYYWGKNDDCIVVTINHKDKVVTRKTKC